ncbi:MAG: hypothetical protein EXR95_01720 [Gemmatimonadetes bacterium]|nr:hypothetical protein [Gemmatimonadota bacterium]
MMRWWSAGLAGGYRTLHHALSPAQALERVVPWANTALLGLLLLALTPIMAWRFGAFAAALLAMGSFAVFTFYEYFVVGYFDHHGIATMGALLSVVFLAAGGAGWVRAESGSSGTRPDEAVARWLPTPAAARRWFVASAVSAAVALWVNAATIVPVLVGVGVGGAVATGWLGRRAGPRAAWRVEPALWRRWGCTGGVLSVASYLFEYFPGHLGMRLEVNHPLYALAWVGAGDLLARLAAGAVVDPEKRVRGDSVWMVVDALAVALLPVVIVVTGERTFRLADHFLFTLHQRYIIEFLTLGSQLTQMGARLIVGRASALPLLVLPLAAALWPTTLEGGVRWAWRTLLVIGVGVVLGFTHTVLSALFGNSWPAALAGDALLAATGFGLARVGGGRALPVPIQAVLALTMAPAVLLIGMAIAQVRWVGVGAALWLGVLVVAASALRRETGFQWSGPRKAVAGVLLAVVFVAAPACFLPIPLDRADTRRRRWLGTPPGGSGDAWAAARPSYSPALTRRPGWRISAVSRVWARSIGRTWTG